MGQRDFDSRGLKRAQGSSAVKKSAGCNQSEGEQKVLRPLKPTRPRPRLCLVGPGCSGSGWVTHNGQSLEI